jgi:hypothetical protein
MNIGRTIRVFRAEPVVSPVPEPEAPVATANRPPVVAQEPPAEIDAGQGTVPARLGG